VHTYFNPSSWSNLFVSTSREEWIGMVCVFVPNVTHKWLPFGWYQVLKPLNSRKSRTSTDGFSHPSSSLWSPRTPFLDWLSITVTSCLLTLQNAQCQKSGLFWVGIFWSTLQFPCVDQIQKWQQIILHFARKESTVLHLPVPWHYCSLFDLPVEKIQINKTTHMYAPQIV